MNILEKKKISWWQTVLLAGTVLAAFLKIYIGMDNDESYIVTMGVRLLNGDRIFKEMWELHMTSAWPAGICAWVWVRLTGSFDGMVIFMRWVSTIAQFGTAIFVYAVIKKYFRQETAFAAGIFVANFLPRATQNMEYGQLEMIFVLISVCLVFDVLMKLRERQKKETQKGAMKYGIAAEWCLAAVCYAASVLAYPTILVSAPFLGYAVWRSLPEKKTAYSLLFWGSCAVCAGFFLTFLFSYLTVPEFLDNLGGILSDGTHSDTMKMQSYGKQIVSVCGRIAMILAGAVALCTLYLTTESVKKRKNQPSREELKIKKQKNWRVSVEMSGYASMASMALILMGLNLTGIRPSGAIGFQARYLLVTVLAAVMLWSDAQRQRLSADTGTRTEKEDCGDSVQPANQRQLIWRIFYLTGIGIYIGVMIGSNMGIEENASFLYLCVLAAIVLFMEQIPNLKKEEDACGKTAWKFASVCMGIFLVGVIFTKGYFVRITGTGPANITEERVVLEEGALKGIRVDLAYKEEYQEKRAEVSGETGEEDNALILCDNAIYNLSSTGNFTSATCISTPVYNEEWVQYYGKEEHGMPTVLFLDRRKYANWETFRECEFGAYLTEKYRLNENSWETGKEFYMLRLEEKR